MLRTLISAPKGSVLARRIILFGFALAAAVTVAGCLSPTLPLPPPSAPLVSAPDNSGFVRVQGEVTSRATVHVMNERTNKGASQLTEDDGLYDLELRAQVGDTLRIWKRVGTQESDFVEVTVPEEDMIEGVPPPAMGGEGP
jgi:hypothetical protein